MLVMTFLLCSAGWFIPSVDSCVIDFLIGKTIASWIYVSECYPTGSVWFSTASLAHAVQGTTLLLCFDLSLQLNK